MTKDLSWATSAEIARAVAAGASSALNVVDDALARIEEHNPALNAFTAIIADRARARAKVIDAAADKAQWPLAGVPFAVKNLFDIEGLATVAGSKINRLHPPAKKDSPLIQRLEAAGAVLLGALNMGDLAYDFTGETSATVRPAIRTISRPHPRRLLGRIEQRGGGGLRAAVAGLPLQTARSAFLLRCAASSATRPRSAG